jgi:hypothetical protein
VAKKGAHKGGHELKPKNTHQGWVRGGKVGHYSVPGGPFKKKGK